MQQADAISEFRANVEQQRTALLVPSGIAAGAGVEGQEWSNDASAALTLPLTRTPSPSPVVPLGSGEIDRQVVAVAGLADCRDAFVPRPAKDFLQLVEIRDLERQLVDRRGAFRRPAGYGSSIGQIKKFAPATGADVAFYDRAGAGLTEQAASGASQPVLRPVLIFCVGLRHLPLRRCRRGRPAEDHTGERRPDQDAA